MSNKRSFFDFADGLFVGTDIIDGSDDVLADDDEDSPEEEFEISLIMFCWSLYVFNCDITDFPTDSVIEALKVEYLALDQQEQSQYHYDWQQYCLEQIADEFAPYADVIDQHEYFSHYNGFIGFILGCLNKIREIADNEPAVAPSGGYCGLS